MANRKTNTNKFTDTEVTKPIVKEAEHKKEIECRSVVNGILFFEGERTKKIYEFADYNDVQNIDYEDLLVAVRTKSRFLFNPYFIVTDEDFVNSYPQLKNFYRDHYSIGDLRKLFTVPINELEKHIKALPPSAITQLKQLVSSAVADGTIDSYKRIQVFDSLLGTNMLLLSR